MELIRFDPDTLSIYVASVCSIWLTTLMLFQFSELYTFEAIVRPIQNFDKILIAFVTGILFLLAAAFAFKLSDKISRVWLGSFGTAALLATFLARLTLAQIFLVLSRRAIFSRNMVIVGEQGHIAPLLERIAQYRPDFVNITGVFADKDSRSSIPEFPIDGNVEEMTTFIRSSRVDDVVIALPWSDEERILSLVERLRELPVNVYLGSDLVGLRIDFSERPGHFANMPIFSVAGHPMSGWGIAIKFVEDYCLGVLFLIIAAIPMALIALLIRLDSPGPVIFRQKRYGFNNQVFWIFKFRTMRIDRPPEIKTIQAKIGDPRVTKIGRFLRRTSLDELPQLFNVLNGTMSLVGPRPHAVDHNEEFSRKIRGYFARHRVKPGITGWAQVNGLRGATTTPEKMEERVRYDVYYTENWSLLFDLRILVQTIFVVIAARNAY